MNNVKANKQFFYETISALLATDLITIKQFHRIKGKIDKKVSV